jgi:PKD repeat protein
LKWLAFFLTEELESIISRWEEPRVFEQRIPELSNEQLLIIGVGSAAAVAAGILAALILIPPPSTTPPPPTPPPAESLTVSIIASPPSGNAPLLVNFTSNVSGGTPPYSYEWNFGDGATSSSANPSHVYQSSGNYSITLRVIDSQGNIQTATASVAAGQTTSPLGAQNVSFSVTASDSEDPYLRYWTLLVDGQTISHTTQDSGATVTANATLQPGSHTLEIEISQSGGPSYGTYSGTAVINGQSHPFSGVDINDPANVPFTV